jgi:hypothetical protein
VPTVWHGAAETGCTRMSPKIGQPIADVGEPEERDYLSSTCFLKKYRGKKWRMVLEEDPDYIRWVLTEADIKLGERLRDELMWALEEQE